MQTKLIHQNRNQFSFRFLLHSVFIIGFSMTTVAQNVTIIESESYNPGHVMDNIWLSVATNMGMNASIAGQSTLYDTAFLSTTDALIVSSGAITLSNSQITAITQFMQSGRSIYLQGEYDCNLYNTNGTFEDLVNSNGGNFTLNGTIAGTLAPMNVLGTLGTTPNTIPPLTYFWYGCRGNACSYVEPFLQYNSDYFGFIFCPPASGYGRVVFTTDQDWINQSTSLPLMENILSLITSNNYQCSGQNYLGANLGIDTTICEDSIYVLNGGGSAFTYLWSTGSTDTSITVNTAGVYWVTVSNGVCTTSDTVVISEIPCSGSPASFAVSDTTICEKFCISFFDSSSNNPVSWLWIFPGGSPSSSTDQNPTNICYQNPGVFDVTLIVTDANGNNDTLTLPDYITVYTNPFAPVITQTGNVLSCTPATSYQWQLNSVDIPGATNQSYNMLQSGLYTVVIGDENGCSAQASVDAALVGISEVEENSFVNIFPNPNSGSFMVEWLNGLIVGEISIEVVNTLGQIIFSSYEKTGGAARNKEIDLGDVVRGMYFIEIKTENEFVRKKILIAS
ncbi:MAG TPA: T9SS type A sorting domain-containing protein [Chitinophagales bacterium]|nr:T9SS type A sorting domain-containing protein [Chitinophagales bacterium]